MLRWLLPLVVAAAGCATVAPYEREHLSDPTMQTSMDPLLDRSIRKLHSAREAASGGDSRPAGGGCGCTN